MEVKFSVTLSDDEEILLRKIFKTNEHLADNFNATICTLAEASFQEYLTMILGKKLFGKTSDFNNFRLLLLTKYVLKGSVPNEDFVSGVFQLTATESRKLIKSMLTKYQYELDEIIEKSLKKIIEKVKIENNKITAEIFSENLKDELNRILFSKRKSGLQQISKERGTVANYNIPIDSYKELCKHFTINPKKVI